MNSSTSERDGETDRKDRGVLCAKCEHLNTWGRNECKRCGSHLYITCSDCGQSNERVRTKCTNCSRRLHHSLMDRVRHRVSKESFQMSGVQVLIFCVGVGLAFGLILMLSHIELPSLF